jgi:membrane-associated phospholipid phosphatase
VLALIVGAVVIYLWIDQKPGAALFIAIAIADGAALEVLLKLGFARPRPELVSRLVDVNSFSFPSGHATMATITYLTLGALLARMQKRRRLKLHLLAVATFSRSSSTLAASILGCTGRQRRCGMACRCGMGSWMLARRHVAPRP